jgi:MFS family permease
MRTESGWSVVLAAYFGVMVGFGSLLVFTFGTFVKPLGSAFGWNREDVSAAFGFAALTVAVCSPFLGRFLDRYGPKRIIIPCMAVFGLSFASLGLLTPHLYHLYAVFVVLGVVGNGTSQMGYSRAVATWFDRRRGLAFALIMAGSGTGSMLFPPLAQTLITHFGWRIAYMLLGALVLILGIPLTALFVRERERSPHSIRDEASSGESVRASVRSRAFWILIATLFLGSISVNGAITHLSPLLTDRGLSLEHAAFVASSLGFASFAGRLVTGALLDRFAGQRVAFLITLATAAGILLLASAASMFTAILAASLIGLGMGAEADVTPYLLTRYFGLRSFSTLYGFSWTAYAVAGALGPWLMGRAFDLTGSYSRLLATLSGAVLLAAIAFLLLPAYSRDKNAS